MMNKRFVAKLLLILFLIEFCLPFLGIFIPSVIAQEGNDDLLYYQGASQSFEDPTVIYAGQWVNVIPVYWKDVGGSRDALDPQNPVAHNNDDDPRVKFVVGGIGKLPGDAGERIIGEYDTVDGRKLIIKEYTIGFDVGAFTDEHYLSYFSSGGTVIPQVDIDQPLLRWEVFDVIERGCENGSCAELEISNPIYSTEDPLHYELYEPYVTYKGYDIDEDRFNTIASRSTDGALGLRVSIDAGLWQPVFKDVVMDGGTFDYSDEVYTRVVSVECKDTYTGYLEDGHIYSVIDTGVGSTQDTMRSIDDLSDEISFANAGEGNDGDESVSSLDPPTDKFTDLGQASSIQEGSECTALAQTFSVHGYYDELSSGLLSETDPSRQVGGLSSGTVPNTIRPLFTPQSDIQVVYSGTYGYIPKEEAKSEVEFTANFGFRPETFYSLYQHVVHYEAIEIRSYQEWCKYSCGLFGLTQCRELQKKWRKLSTPSQNKIDNVVVAYGLKNMFAVSSFYLKVQIGAYYEWQESEDLPDYQEDPDRFGDFGRTQGDDIFPVVRSGTTEAEIERTFFDEIIQWIGGIWENAPWLLILIIIAVVGICCVLPICLFLSWRGGGGGGGVRQTFIPFSPAQEPKPSPASYDSRKKKTKKKK
jgi:hypothetical protein